MLCVIDKCLSPQGIIIDNYLALQTKDHRRGEWKQADDGTKSTGNLAGIHNTSALTLWIGALNADSKDKPKHNANLLSAPCSVR
jgi:hypothetical protein